MTRTPTQQRAWDDLLAVDQLRPVPDPTWVEPLRARLEKAAWEACDDLPADVTLRLNKTALDALNCDGRYLDLRSEPFEWSPRLLLGKLAHRAIELDHAGGFQRPVRDVVEHAWMETATDRGSSATFVAELGGVAADGLRGAVSERVISFRESFPCLPASAEVRAEKPYLVRLADGRVHLRGVPDLVLGRAMARERLRAAGHAGHRRRPVPRRDVLPRRGVLGARGHHLRSPRSGRAHGGRQGRAGRGAGPPAADGAPAVGPRPACRWCRRAPGCPAALVADAAAGGLC